MIKVFARNWYLYKKVYILCTHGAKCLLITKASLLCYFTRSSYILVYISSAIYNEQMGWNLVTNAIDVQKHLDRQCTFWTAFVMGMNDYHCIWSFIMQKLKNILGSRKKGAQEPHAAREPRYDYQGNTTSNLKGISLESLTLPAGITSYCMCPLFFLLFPSTIEDFFLILLNVCVCVFCLLSPFRELRPDAGWVQEYGGCSHRYGLSDQSVAAPAYWWAGRLMVDIFQSQTDGEEYVCFYLPTQKLG